MITRKDVEEHIKEKCKIPEKDIINDINKVGNNCISWIMTTDTGIKIKAKIYNKIAQMWESPEVRSPIGSRMADIVANPSKGFQDTMIKAKYEGLSRMEITIPLGEIYSYEEYYRLFSELVELMKGCIIYKTSYENQWKSMLDKLENTNTAAVYVRNKKVFGYIHWINRLTRKKQGYVKKGVDEKEIITLLANYSFNGRPMIYKEITTCDDGEYTIDKMSKYKRVEESKAYTLVPGIQKGLYPSEEMMEREVIAFEEMGMIEYKGMSIGWPKARINKQSRPLAEIVEVTDTNENDEGNRISIINNIRASDYSAGYVILEENKIYLVIAIGVGKYRRQEGIIFAKVMDENRNILNVRCGKELSKIIEEMETNEKFFIRTGEVFRKFKEANDIEVYK